MPKKDSLSKRLFEIDALRADTENGPEKMENEYLALVREYDSDEDKGRIYAAIVTMYANNGMQHSTKVVKYAKKSLHYPLEVLKACQIYLYLTDALLAKDKNSTGPAYSMARNRSIVPCLKGLRLVLDYLNYTEKQPVPFVSKFDYDGPADDSEYQAILKQHKNEITRREEVMSQNKLVEYHDQFISKCIALYSREPYKPDELQQLAGEILKNDRVVKNLLAKVEVSKKNTGDKLL